MILNHLWGIYTHPKEEWHAIDRQHESYFYSLSHICIIALIPAVMSYYASAHLGWSIGVGEVIKLGQQSALSLGIGTYFGLMAGVIFLAIIMHELAKVFDSEPTYTQSLELAAYTATPLFMCGFAAFYPALWFVMSVAFIGVSYSIYLLYSGVPIMLHIPEDKGFIYSSSVVTAGLILLVVLMVGTVLLWSVIGDPVFTH
ncbi:Yip1 family protein [Aliiglaciecola litoralis]|uniref:Yip1 family protein n=1 Tax=Aliiglaciecola litoralis TaxID=582857 RepID=A0ABP3WXD4_9ALTE